MMWGFLALVTVGVLMTALAVYLMRAVTVPREIREHIERMGHGTNT